MGGGRGGEVRSSVQEEKCKQRMAEGDFPLELHRKSRAAWLRPLISNVTERLCLRSLIMCRTICLSLHLQTAFSFQRGNETREKTLAKTTHAVRTGGADSWTKQKFKQPYSPMLFLWVLKRLLSRSKLYKLFLNGQMMFNFTSLFIWALTLQWACSCLFLCVHTVMNY